LAWRPALLTLIRVVRPVLRSWTKMSNVRLVSPGTRFESAEWKAT
jgi:hypothetical protein